MCISISLNFLYSKNKFSSGFQKSFATQESVLSFESNASVCLMASRACNASAWIITAAGRLHPGA